MLRVGTIQELSEEQEPVLNAFQELVATVLLAPGLVFFLNETQFGLSGNIRQILVFQKFHVGHDILVHDLKNDAVNTRQIIGFVLFAEMVDFYC